MYSVGRARGFTADGLVSSVPVYVTRYSPLCTRRPPVAKYMAPSFSLTTRSVSGSGAPVTNSSVVPL